MRRGSEIFALAMSLLWWLHVPALAADSFLPSTDASADFTTQVLLSNLDEPVGVALRPVPAKQGPYELFVAEHSGRRVLRVTTDAPESARDAVTDFKPEGGPRGLLFLDRNRLVVGISGASRADNVLAGFVMRPDNATLSSAEPDFAVGPLKPEISSNIDGLQFANLALAEKTVFATTGGRAAQGWVLKSSIEANRLASLQPLIDVQDVAGYGAPGGITMIPPPRPAFLVVALMGDRETPHDSRLAFFVPATGELAMLLPTGLHDLVSLAYSPSGQLYAADASWETPQDGGIYRIDDAQVDGRQTCRAVKIASLVHPMSLAFAPDGSLYATALNNRDTGEPASAGGGTLVKITGNL